MLDYETGASQRLKIDPGTVLVITISFDLSGMYPAT